MDKDVEQLHRALLQLHFRRVSTFFPVDDPSLLTRSCRPANCFGRAHLDKVLQTHKDMQAFLFDGKNGDGTTVINHLKSMISDRFNNIDVPDAFLYVPEYLGGLDLRNPFIPLLLVRHDLLKDPEARMRKFHEQERKEWEDAKKEFESMTSHERWRRYRSVYPKDEEEVDNIPGEHKEVKANRLRWEDAQKFWSFEEYTKWRECSSFLLCEAYTQLMAQPPKKDIILSEEVRWAWKNLEGLGPTPFAISSADKDSSVDQVDSVAAWTVQYHADELFEKCGGLSVLDTGLLPLGVLKALKSRKVTWQMVL